MKLLIGLVLMFICGALITTLLFNFGDRLEEQQAEIYFNGTIEGFEKGRINGTIEGKINGTAIGQAQMINYISQNKVIPFFTDDGNVSQMSWVEFCTQLNKTGGK